MVNTKSAKILLFGKNSQVGRRLCEKLLPLGHLITFGSKEVDFRDINKLRQCIKTYKPDFIVNCAAYTQVDKAESEIQEVFAINTEAVKVIAEEAERANSWLLHYSSEYVFDGLNREAYKEDDIVKPLNVYGQSKANGDRHIVQISTKYIILRSSWIFDSYGKNFPKTILSLAQKNSFLHVVDDQVGSPTSAVLIASVTSFILYKILTDLPSETKNLSGIYNIASSGETSWHKFAYFLIQEAYNLGITLSCLPENVTPISSQHYHTPAKRPLNSRLNTDKLSHKFGLVMPKWELYIPSLLNELKITGVL